MMRGKKLKRLFWFSLLFLCLFGCENAFASGVPSSQQPVQAPPVQIPPVEFVNCSKYFKVNSQTLFYLTLSSINANRFVINEIQSNSGYILFSVNQKQFLASVITVDALNSMLKITPTDNNYLFPIGIIQNIFKYIELNLNTPIEKLKVL